MQLRCKHSNGSWTVDEITRLIRFPETSGEDHQQPAPTVALAELESFYCQVQEARPRAEEAES